MRTAAQNYRTAMITTAPYGRMSAQTRVNGKTIRSRDHMFENKGK